MFVLPSSDEKENQQQQHSRYLVVHQQEGELCSLYSLKGPKNICDAIGQALKKSHEEKKKGEITTTNHITLSNFLISQFEEYDDLTFEQMEDEDFADEDEEEEKRDEIFRRYFGEITLADLFECELKPIEEYIVGIHLINSFDGVISTMGFC